MCVRGIYLFLFVIDASFSSSLLRTFVSIIVIYIFHTSSVFSYEWVDYKLCSLMVHRVVPLTGLKMKTLKGRIVSFIPCCPKYFEDSRPIFSRSVILVGCESSR